MAFTVWDENKIEQLHECLQRGMFAAQIARHIGVSSCAVRDYCRKNELDLPLGSKSTINGKRLSSIGGRMKATDWPDERITKDQFLAAYEHAQTMTQLRDRARHLSGKDCSVYRLKPLIKELGLKKLKEDATESIPHSQANVGLLGHNI